MMDKHEETSRHLEKKQSKLRDSPSAATSAKPQPFDAHQIVPRLHQICEKLFSEVLKAEDPEFRFQPAVKRELQEGLHRFILWKTGWKDDRLEICFGGSPDLHISVLELMYHLAEKLLRSTSRSLVLI